MPSRLVLAAILVGVFYVAVGWRWVRGAWRAHRFGIAVGPCRHYAGQWWRGRALGADRVPDGPTIYVQRSRWRRRVIYVGRAVSYRRRATQHRYKAEAEEWGYWEALVLPDRRSGDLPYLEALAIRALNPETNTQRPDPQEVRR
jgi:hypothetical protein